MVVSPRFLALIAVLALVLLLSLLGACGSEDGADRSDQDSGDRSTSSLSGGRTSTPETTRDSPSGGGGDQTTASSAPGTTSSQPQPLPTRVTTDPARIPLILEGETPLHRAALEGDPTKVSELLGQGEYIEARASDLLWRLVNSRNYDQAREYLETNGLQEFLPELEKYIALYSESKYDEAEYYYPRIYQSITPLEVAAVSYRPDVVELLLDQGAEIGQSLRYAVMFNPGTDVAQLLLNAGASASEGTAGVAHSQPLLFYAIRYNPNTALVELLLEHGASIDQTASGQWPFDSTRVTPLHYAAAFNPNPAMTALLLDLGGDVGARMVSRTHGTGKDMPLHLALSTNPEPGVVAVLLDWGADPNANRSPETSRRASPLAIAIKERDDSVVAAAMVELLLGAGADVNVKEDLFSYNDDVTPLHLAMLHDGPAIAKLLLDAGANIEARDSNPAKGAAGKTPLHWAALSGTDSTVMIDFLLDQGAVIEAKSADGFTPLHFALGGGNIGSSAASASLPSAQVLVDRGANVNAASSESSGGVTPLHLAAGRGYVSIEGLSQEEAAKEFARLRLQLIESLIDAGASIEARDSEGQTPLHTAVEASRSATVVEALLDSGANINATDDAGRTPLHIAVDMPLSRIEGVVELLLDRGADVDAVDGEGQTPCQLAHYSYDALEGLCPG